MTSSALVLARTHLTLSEEEEDLPFVYLIFNTWFALEFVSAQYPQALLFRTAAIFFDPNPGILTGGVVAV